MKLSNLATSIIIIIGTILSTFGVQITQSLGADLITAVQSKNVFQIITAGFAVYNVVKHIQKPSDGNYFGFLTSTNFWAQTWAILVNAIGALSTATLSAEDIAIIVSTVQSKDIWQMIAVIAPILSKTLSSIFKKSVVIEEPQA
jgi:hypothetical protein